MLAAAAREKPEAPERRVLLSVEENVLTSVSCTGVAIRAQLLDAVNAVYGSWKWSILRREVWVGRGKRK
jgi:hypothetical protein